MASPKINLPTASLTRDEALALLESRAQIAQNELAGHTDAGGEVLHYLAENGAVATRRAVAANPAAEARTNFYLSEDEDEEVEEVRKRWPARCDCDAAGRITVLTRGGVIAGAKMAKISELNFEKSPISSIPME